MGLYLVNMLGFSSCVHFAHITCYWKFLLLHYTQVLCQYRRENSQLFWEPHYIAAARDHTENIYYCRDMLPSNCLAKSMVEYCYSRVFTTLLPRTGHGQPTLKTLLLLSELLCNVATSCSLYCCVFAGTCMLRRCLAMVIFFTLLPPQGCLSRIAYRHTTVSSSEGCARFRFLVARFSVVFILQLLPLRPP
jgi:hypothetical protein